MLQISANIVLPGVQAPFYEPLRSGISGKVLGVGANVARQPLNLKRSTANQNGFNRLLPETFFSVQTKEVIDNPLNVHFINVFRDIVQSCCFIDNMASL